MIIIINENNINRRKHNKNASHSSGYKTLNMMFRDPNSMNTYVFLNYGHFGAMNNDSYIMRTKSKTHDFHVSNLLCVIGLEFTLCSPNLKYIFIE
jgi:hypothetical protein